MHTPSTSTLNEPMATETPAEKKSRLTKIGAAVGVAATALTAVIALMNYLHSRPTDVETFRASVGLWCAAVKAGQPKSDSAFDTSRFEWSPDRVRELTRAVEAHDARGLATFRELAPPPLELRDSYAATESSLIAWFEADTVWMRALRKASDRKIRRSEFPDLPEMPTGYTSVQAEANANLASLSANSESCRGETP